MKPINKNNILFIAMILVLLCIAMYLKYAFDALTIVDGVMMSLMAVVGLVALNISMLYGLMIAFLVTLGYGLLVILSGTTNWTASFDMNYYYLILPSVIGIVLGCLGLVNNSYLRTSRNFEDDYKELVRIDALTGFRNKQDYDENLGEELERAKRYNQELSLMVIHIESFDDLNHLYGLSQGEKFLKHFSEFVIEITRQSDKHYRIGHNLFALILPNTNYDGAALLKERFIQDFESMNIVVKSSQQKVAIEIDIVFEAYRDGMTVESFHQTVLDELVVKPRGEYEENS